MAEFPMILPPAQFFWSVRFSIGIQSDQSPYKVKESGRLRPFQYPTPSGAISLPFGSLSLIIRQTLRLITGGGRKL
jgi:hypothetical protein